MVEEEKQEVAASDEEEDDDEGPPPGFQCIITPRPPPEAENAEAEEEDGPPPGFDCIAPKSFPSPPSSAETTHIERFEASAPLDTTSSKQDDMEDDEDGPPPGWEFNKLVNALPEEPSCTADIKEEGDDDLDEGPPPGWELVFPCQMSQPHTPTMQPPSTVSPNSEMGSKQMTPKKNENEVPRFESEDTPMLGQSSPATSPPKQLPSSEQLSAMTESACATYLDASNKNDEQMNEKRATSGHHPVSHLQQLPSNPHPFTPVPKSSSSEKAQLVCGTCRKLCLYPQGTKWIRCPGCQEVNFVLEAHEVGQVKCGACAVLLMYPHGAPAVQCSSCRSVTEIGAHNRRPPLSVQQAEARRRRRCNRAR